MGTLVSIFAQVLQWDASSRYGGDWSEKVIKKAALAIGKLRFLLAGQERELCLSVSSRYRKTCGCL